MSNWIALLLAVGISGCESQIPGGSGALVRDSAGVRIVENSTPVWGSGSGWRLSDAAILEIGSMDGDPAEQFSEIMGAARLEDGRWVIADGASAELRLFGPDGRHDVTLNRRGSGPGELPGIFSFQWLPGDLLAVREQGGVPRFAFVDVNGGVVRRTQLPPPAEGPPFVVVGWLDDSTAVVSRNPRPTLGPGEQFTPQSTYSSLRPDGSIFRQIATAPGTTIYGRERGPPIGLTMGARLLPDVSPDGLTLGMTEGGEIHRYEVDGSLAMVIRRETPPVIIDRAMIARYTDGWVAVHARSGVSPDALDQARQGAEESVFAEHAPSHSRVLTDQEGNVWAREWVVEHALPQEHSIPTYENPDRWWVFDATGRWLGHVETPANFFVFEIGADYVVGLHRGEWGIERIRVYELVKR